MQRPLTDVPSYKPYRAKLKPCAHVMIASTARGGLGPSQTEVDVHCPRRSNSSVCSHVVASCVVSVSQKKLSLVHECATAYHRHWKPYQRSRQLASTSRSRRPLILVTGTKVSTASCLDTCCDTPHVSRLTARKAALCLPKQQSDGALQDFELRLPDDQTRAADY